MCWSGSEILVSMLLFSAAGEWWIDMAEEDGSPRMVDGKRESRRATLDHTYIKCKHRPQVDRIKPASSPWACGLSFPGFSNVS